MIRRFSRAVVGLALIGCEAPGASPPAEGSPSTDAAYTSPADVPLPFRATIPNGVRVEEEVYAEGRTVTFTAASGEERDDRAFLHFVVESDSASEAAAREIVRSAVESYRVPGTRVDTPNVPPPSWALVKHPIESRGTPGEPITGWVALGYREGRWFHILVQQPQSLEASFGPQVDRILRSWRWLNGGEPLQAE